MNRDALIDRVREILGDETLEGNTDSWEEPEILAALNFAQDYYARVTQCTYTQVAAVVSAAGLIDLTTLVGAADVLDVVRIMTPESEPALDASIAIVGIPTVNVTFTANVADHPGASYLWSLGGGTLLTGQGTPQITLKSLNSGSLFLSCAVSMGGTAVRWHKIITVVEA